jgi:HlyD family secretion protein
MKRYWIAFSILLILLLWWAFGSSKRAPGIHFAEVRRTTIESTVPTNGKVEPVEWAAARAEISGVVQTVDVQRGEDVRKGQTLVTLDSASTRSELAAALATEESAATDLANLQRGGKAGALSSIESSIRSGQTAVDVTQRNYDSLVRLEKQQAATRQQVLDAADALTRAKQQLSSYQEQRRTLVTTGDVSVAQAKLRDADAALAYTRHQLALATVRSPMSGTVYQFDLKKGAYLQPGTLVAYVGQLDRVKVSVYVDEPDLGRVKKGMLVDFTWEAHPGRHWWGSVEKLPTEIVPLDTRHVGEVTAIVDNPNHDLLPNVTVNATVVSAIAKNAVSIPKPALNGLGNNQGVYKLNGNTIVWTPVQTGVSDVNNVQILSGLKAGDRVALRGDTELSSGMQVTALGS